MVNLSKKWWFVIAVAVVVIATAAYFLFFSVKDCADLECFKESMAECKKASFIHEVKEASWGFEIKGESDGLCDINVVLLQVKVGELGLDRLEGYDMDCSYPLGERTEPQKDLDKCEGPLKEKLQEIVIESMHGYVLNNLGKIKEGLNRVS